MNNFQKKMLERLAAYVLVLLLGLNGALLTSEIWIFIITLLIVVVDILIIFIKLIINGKIDIS